MKIALFAGFIISISYIVLLRHQLNSISKQLESRAGTIRVALFDNVLSNLATQINRIMEREQEVRISADKSERALKQMVADISHDFRTPLTAIIGYLQLFREERSETHIDAALRRAQTLKDLVSRFYELALIDGGIRNADFKKVNLANLLSEILFSYVDAFEQMQIIPHITGFDQPVYAYVDISMLERIMQNLVSNCLKYSQGEVNFTLSNTDAITLTIKNKIKSGITINEKKVFDRLYTGDPARGGSGLGLYIVRTLVEAMGGTAQARLSGDIFYIHLFFSHITPVKPPLT